MRTRIRPSYTVNEQDKKIMYAKRILKDLGSKKFKLKCRLHKVKPTKPVPGIFCPMARAKEVTYSKYVSATFR